MKFGEAVEFLNRNNLFVDSTNPNFENVDYGDGDNMVRYWINHIDNPLDSFALGVIEVFYFDYKAETRDHFESPGADWTCRISLWGLE